MGHSAERHFRVGLATGSQVMLAAVGLDSLCFVLTALGVTLMSSITVIEPHKLPVDEAISRLAVFEQMVSKFGVSIKWKGAQADIKGMGIKGSIKVTDSDATIALKLGMLARAAGVDAKRLQGSVSKRLRSAFDA